MDPKYREALLNGTATPETAPQAAPQAPQPAEQDGGQGVLSTLIQSVGRALNPVGGAASAVSKGLDATLGPDNAVSKAASGYSDMLNDSDTAGVTGGLKSVFETKDFLFGDTPTADRSQFRATAEDMDAALKEERPIVAGLSSGIGQFTVAMIGLGKAGMLAKSLPYIGETLASSQGAIEATKLGRTVLESGKAALAGSIAFDPHEERLSNLIQDTPLANPITEWLAAKPSDTAAWGRVKSAMESIGMDAAIIGTLKLGGTVWKYLRSGNTKAARRAITDFEARRAADMEAPVEIDPAMMETPDGAAPGQPLGQQADNLGGSATGPSGVPEAPQPGSAGVPAPVAEGLANAGSAAAPSPLEAVPGNAGAGEVPPSGGSPAGSVQVTPTANPTQAMADLGVTKPKAFKTTVDVTAPDVAGANPLVGQGPRTKGVIDDLRFELENAEKDWANIDNYGDVLKAQENGYAPAKDMREFYDRMNTDTDIIHAIDLMVNLKQDELASQGFRGVLTDQKLQRQVKAFASLSGRDPAGIMGILSQGAEATKTLTAKMIVIGSMTTKAFTDASLMATRYKLGDFSEFGSKEAMEAAIAKRFSVATTMLRMTDEYRAQAGRSLRALRGKPFDPSLFEGLSKERFYDLLAKSKGSPQKLKILADPSLYTKLMDTLSYMRINNLVSGWTSQTINLITTSYLVGVRPLERLGPAAVHYALTGDNQAAAVMRQNLAQYRYMGAALMDGWHTAVDAFVKNDSILRPHGQEAFNIGEKGAWRVPGSQAIDGSFFKPWDSVPNLIHNSLSVPLAANGIPTRSLGAADELMKQIVYRSHVMSRASLEAGDKAAEMGLSGTAARNFMRSYVDDAVNNAFDAAGRGVNPDALREANISTFQQDLLPGTIGKNIQTALSNDKTRLGQFILPFIKTPTNVIRYGWKMTPLLNIAQGEYRAMLSGKMGREAQYQAIGQVSMGALFMGALAFAGQDRVTGGGPTDPRVKAELLATGWRPYSFVFSNEDGTKTYVPFNRFDPVGLPFGIMADIQDAMAIHGEGEQPAEMQAAIGSLMMSLAKQFTSKTYLLSLNQALEALSAPDRQGERFMGQLAASLGPFGSFTRQTSTDPYMRDARSVADRMMAVTPGMSDKLPLRYNWLGQPVVNRTGLWTDDNGSLVDQEVQRLSLLPDASMISVPSPRMGRVDLREITMADGMNAYEKYQQLSGKPGPNARSLRDKVADMMRTEAYQKAPDGDTGLKGTKLFMLSKLVYSYRDAAAKILKADPNVREALLKDIRAVADHWKHLKQDPSAKPNAQQDGSLGAILDGFTTTK